MPANTSPIFTLTPRISVGGAILGPSANTAQDGTGANSFLVFTAGSNGSFVEEITLKPVGSPAATVMRVFYCSDTGTFTAGTTNTTSTTAMLDDVSTAAIVSSNVSGSFQYKISLQRTIPANTKLFVTFGTSTGAAGTGYAIAVFGGDY
jgi:hypothetical protein